MTAASTVRGAAAALAVAAVPLFLHELSQLCGQLIGDAHGVAGEWLLHGLAAAALLCVVGNALHARDAIASWRALRLRWRQERQRLVELLEPLVQPVAWTDVVRAPRRAPGATAMSLRGPPLVRC